MKMLHFVIISFIIALTPFNAHALPSFQEMKESYKKSDAVLLDRHGEIIHELRIDAKGRRLDWISLNDISPSFIKAVIHSEDKRFYEHHGVDWKAIGSAAIQNIFSKTRRGASTITMQLASMLEKRLKPKGGKRTIAQKWDQIKTAEEIERKWTKNEILEAYLNLITFRGELQGIYSASRGLFDKEPAGLNDIESFVLASFIPSPNTPAKDVIKRGCALAASMQIKGVCEEIKALAEKTVTTPYRIKPHIAIAPHAAYQLIKGNVKKAVSTLDAKLQRLAVEAVRHQLNLLKNQNVQECAAIVVENNTGEILAYVGNSGLSSNSRYVDGIKAKRQAGSALKPFLYELALERMLLTSASILEDSPVNVSTPAGLYVPQNYDNDYKGFITVRTALASSLNIPAVKTLSIVEPDFFVSRLKQLGFGIEGTGDDYGMSLALGSADVSLYELVNAFRALANTGVMSELKIDLNDKKPAKKMVMKKEAVFIISDILSDREARSLTFGFENPLSTKFWTAVKTGTSKDMRDNWCIGYSRHYTVGVWVGNFSGEPMWNVSGISGAAPVWLEIMSYLHKNKKSLPPQPPEGIISRTVKFNNEIEPERTEWFIKGSEQTLFLINKVHQPVKIIYPADGAIIAFDPDIPEENQAVFFEANNRKKEFNWILNGKKIGSSNGKVLWKPEHGSYLLSLVDSRNNILDSVRFEVRGKKYE